MRHKIRVCSYHCYEHDCDFRPCCLSSWIVAVRLIMQLDNLCDFSSSAWTVYRILPPFPLPAKEELVSRGD